MMVSLPAWSCSMASQMPMQSLSSVFSSYTGESMSSLPEPYLLHLQNALQRLHPTTPIPST